MSSARLFWLGVLAMVLATVLADQASKYLEKRGWGVS